ncbi:signal transduction histidine kinase [Streptomyces phaeochromogenes]|uniref:sensor histidine kinase n=1 Tax=Streptomyces phaeochromogenes TaxID=1923 RepID=UPI002792B617|nr:histidine kinase [Streptomyces phaeochromogenes]MDQ0946701.1 signal transduction histidine kinase [Streptomyces phaeochromogenes]
MKRTDIDTDDRLFPVLLICAQAVVWPGVPLVRGAVPPASALLVAALVAGVVTAALALRRTRPVATLVVVAAACALGAGPLPAGAMALLGTAGVALALFTVATERDAFTVVLCVVALAAWQLLQGISLHGLSDRNGLDLVLTALLYAAVCGAGLRVRRTRRARRAAEQRLKRAESERHRLPAVERRRMERELHDISAHHLTAVVVTAGAALGLRDRRPELAEEALEFAVETGREVTRALGAVRAPAPSRGDEPSPEERLLDLVAGFRRLDQQVDCEITPLPDGAVAEAAYGIVREALTNVARYAPGAHTRVLCRYGESRTDVVVTSTPPSAGAVAHGAGLGGGRGQGFLRSRAREAGGTVHSGPTAEGGWEVRAVLPGRTVTTVEPSAPRTYRLAQVVAAAGLILQPLLPVLVIRAEETSSATRVSAGVFFALLAAGQAVALLWLRRAPRTAYGMLLGLALLWPVAMAVGNYSGPVLLPPALSLLATCAALAMMEPTRTATPRKRRGVASKRGSAAPGAPDERGSDQPPPARGHIPTIVLMVLVHAVAATTAVLDRGTAAPIWTVIAGTTVGATLTGTAAHLAGRLRTRRRQSDRRAHDERLAAWTEEAVRDAWNERRRIAAGLETTILARTTDMVTEAEAGRLDATATRAREALAAMRTLLDTVREGDTGAELRPQPTLQALDLLAHQLRATGRDIEIRLTDRVPERLPTAVDLAAYRAAETVLAAGGEEPAMLELDVDNDTLTLTATGVPRAADSAVRERLTTRVAALGGTLTTGPQGTVRLRLPLAVAPDNEERHQ